MKRPKGYKSVRGVARLYHRPAFADYWWLATFDGAVEPIRVPLGGDEAKAREMARLLNTVTGQWGPAGIAGRFPGAQPGSSRTEEPGADTLLSTILDKRVEYYEHLAPEQAPLWRGVRKSVEGYQGPKYRHVTLGDCGILWIKGYAQHLADTGYAASTGISYVGRLRQVILDSWPDSPLRRKMGPILRKIAWGPGMVKKASRPISMAEFHQLMESLRKDPRKYRWEISICLLGAGSLLRRASISFLHQEHMQQDKDGQWWIYQEKPVGFANWVPKRPVLVPVLPGWMSEQIGEWMTGTREYYFPSHDPLWVGRRFGRICERTIGGKRNVHSLRSLGATNLPAPRQVAQLMGGWSRIKTLEQYYLKLHQANFLAMKEAANAWSETLWPEAAGIVRQTFAEELEDLK